MLKNTRITIIFQFKKTQETIIFLFFRSVQLKKIKNIQIEILKRVKLDWEGRGGGN